jgi:hypothetical protein
MVRMTGFSLTEEKHKYWHMLCVFVCVFRDLSSDIWGDRSLFILLILAEFIVKFSVDDRLK